LSIYGGLDNVFDEAYEESYGFPQSGRVAYIGLDVQL
jgi:outer membrane cobalamin receptor